MNLYHAKKTIDEYEQWTECERVDGQDDNITYDLVALIGEAGELASAWKKRKKGALTPEAFREELLLEVGDIMHYCARLLHSIGADYTECVNANVEKLENRKKYGKGKFGVRS